MLFICSFLPPAITHQAHFQLSCANDTVFTYVQQWYGVPFRSSLHINCMHPTHTNIGSATETAPAVPSSDAVTHEDSAAVLTTNAAGGDGGDNGERQLGLTLIDCPGHVDFSAEVTSALRMTDGALVVVDVVEGKSAQTETVLLQAMQERVKPVLMLNKCDRLLLEKQLSAEQVSILCMTIGRFALYFIGAPPCLMQSHCMPNFCSLFFSRKEYFSCHGLTTCSQPVHPPHYYIILCTCYNWHFHNMHFREIFISFPQNAYSQLVYSQIGFPFPQVFDRCEEVIAQVNAMIAAHQDPLLPDQRVSLENGSVAFGSGYFQWSATLDTFVDMVKPGCSVSERTKLRLRLSRRDRFATHVLGPIFRIHRDLGLIHGDDNTAATTEPTPAFLRTWLDKFNGKLAGMAGRCVIQRIDDVAAKAPRKVLKTVMAHFLPAADALLAMMVVHLPSPVEAQAYRASILYRNRDATFRTIATCDAAAPLMLSIAKMVQPSETSQRHGGLLAIGRVFAGTVRTGDIVRVAGMSPAAHPRSGVKVGQVLQCVGRHMEALGCAYAGQIVAISGVSTHLRKSGTLTTSPTAIPINEMKFSVSPVVLKSIKPKDPRQLKKMVTAMRQIAQADQTAQFYQDEETKEYVLAGAGMYLTFLYVHGCLRVVSC